MSENVLTIENATMQFGGVVAVDNLNLKVDKDQIVSLIGPNGAGKTTAFNVVTGVYAPTNGAVWFEGRKIIENTPHGKMKKLYKGQNASKYSHMIAPTPDKITQTGIARTFQNIRLWKSQTVFENVLIAKHCRRSANLLSATFRLNADEEKRQREECENLLHVLGLEDVRNELATGLPYGLQRRVEIARALATVIPAHKTATLISVLYRQPNVGLTAKAVGAKVLHALSLQNRGEQIACPPQNGTRLSALPEKPYAAALSRAAWHEGV